jgi:hypothetical protein
MIMVGSTGRRSAGAIAPDVLHGCAVAGAGHTVASAG